MCPCVCVFVYESDRTVSSAKTAELIGMPIGMLPCMGPRSRVRDWVLWLPPGEYDWTIRPWQRCGLWLPLTYMLQLGDILPPDALFYPVALKPLRIVAVVTFPEYMYARKR